MTNKKDLVDFLINVGKLKRKKRKGWTVLHKIKNSESTAGHIFRLTILAWVLGKEKNLNLEKVIKMALVHDLCEVYAEDETPYDPVLTKNRKKNKEIIKKRSRMLYSVKQREKKLEKKFKNELKSLKKLTSNLPFRLKEEIINIWLEFENRSNKEGDFVKQLDKMENLLQALEYWKEQGQIQRNLWIISAQEWCTDPVLIEFLNALDKKFSKRKKSNKKTVKIKRN